MGKTGSKIKMYGMIASFVLLFTVGLKLLAGWSFIENLTVSILYAVVGGFLLMEGFYRVKRYSWSNWKSYFHVVTAVFGLILVYTALLNLDFLGKILLIAPIASMTGVLSIIGALLALVETRID